MYHYFLSFRKTIEWCCTYKWYAWRLVCIYQSWQEIAYQLMEYLYMCTFTWNFRIRKSMPQILFISLKIILWRTILLTDLDLVMIYVWPWPSVDLCMTLTLGSYNYLVSSIQYVMVTMKTVDGTDMVITVTMSQSPMSYGAGSMHKMNVYIKMLPWLVFTRWRKICLFANW